MCQPSRLMICNKQFLFSPMFNCVVVLVTQSPIIGANSYGCVANPVSPRWDSTLCSFGASCLLRATHIPVLEAMHTAHRSISAQRCCKPVPDTSDTSSVRHEVLPGQLPAKKTASIIAHGGSWRLVADLLACSLAGWLAGWLLACWLELLACFRSTPQRVAPLLWNTSGEREVNNRK